MKILMLIPNMAGGGAERFTIDLSNQLSEEHELVFLTLYDISVYDLFRGQLSVNINLISLGKRSGIDWRMIFRLYKTIRELQPDIIHTHVRSLNYLVPLIPFMNYTPVVHTIHADAYHECANRVNRFIRRLCFNFKRIHPVTISKESDRSFGRAYRQAGRTIIYNGRKEPIKSADFENVKDQVEQKKRDKKSKVFLTIGRMEPVKNHLMLIAAFKRLVENDGANAVLLIIGGNRNHKESEEIYRELKKTAAECHYIHLLGELKNATDYLHAADYFCLSSIIEGMPITLIEAFATGTIPVCTPVGGIPEMIHDLDASLLSKSANEQDYYLALRQAYEMPDEKQKDIKKRAVRLFQEKYLIKKCSDQYTELYQAVLSDHSKPSHQI